MGVSQWNFIDRSDMSVEQRLEVFQGILSDAYWQYFPEKTYKTRISDPGCVGSFNENLKNIKNTVHFLGEVCRVYGTLGNRQIFESYQKQYKQAIIDSKRTYNHALIRSSKNPTK